MGQAAVGVNLERTNLAAGRVVDVQHRLVGRKGEPVGTVEIVGDPCENTVVRNAVQAVARLFFLLTVRRRFTGNDSVGRVRKIDRAVRAANGAGHFPLFRPSVCHPVGRLSH